MASVMGRPAGQGVWKLSPHLTWDAFGLLHRALTCDSSHSPSTQLRNQDWPQ